MMVLALSSPSLPGPMTNPWPVGNLTLLISTSRAFSRYTRIYLFFKLQCRLTSLLQFSGSVDPSSLTVAAGLYVKVPVAGRVKVASIKGSLLGKGVEASINVVAAKGSVTFYAKSNAQKKHDLCCTLTLKVVLVKSLSLKDVKLWSLP